MKKHWLNFLVLLAVAGVFSATSAVGAEGPAAGEVVRGPFWSGTIRGRGRNEIIADKGIVITVGADKKAHVCYDTDLVRLSLAWTGDFLEFGNTLTRIEWPPPPQVKGAPVFGTRPGPGWAKSGDFSDPRPNHQGPLPKDWAHYRGLYLDGDEVVLAYTAGKTEVLELPGYEAAMGIPVFSRTLNVAASEQPVMVAVCKFDGEPGKKTEAKRVVDGKANFLVAGEKNRLAAGVVGEPPDVKLIMDSAGQLWAGLPASRKPIRLKLVIAAI